MTTTVGDTRRINASFTDSESVALDATNLKFYIEDPSGNIETHAYPDSIERVSTGEYYLDIIVDESGIWKFKIESTGAITACEEGSFVVSPNRVNP